MGANDFIVVPDEDCFPNNAVLKMKDSLQSYDEKLFVTSRQLRPSDPGESIGVFPMQWNPEEDSYEIKGSTAGSEPSLQRYLIGVQASIKDSDENRGLLRHATLSKIVRVMLYRDPALAVSLRSLSVDILGGTEQLQRYGIRTARYLSTEISGSWLYLSTLEFWIETEIV